MQKSSSLDFSIKRYTSHQAIARTRKLDSNFDQFLSSISNTMMTSSDGHRIKVQNLLNNAPARGKSSHRSTPSSPDIFDIVCDAPNCSRKFATKDALYGHKKRSHAAPTGYICSVCQSSFSTPANLSKHVSKRQFSSIFRSSDPKRSDAVLTHNVFELNGNSDSTCPRENQTVQMRAMWPGILLQGRLAEAHSHGSWAD